MHQPGWFRTNEKTKEGMIVGYAKTGGPLLACSRTSASCVSQLPDGNILETGVLGTR